MLAKGIYSSSAITYKALTNNKIILLRGSTSSWSTPELPLALGHSTAVTTCKSGKAFNAINNNIKEATEEEPEDSRIHCELSRWRKNGWLCNKSRPTAT